MKLQDYLRVLRERWLIIAIAVAIGVAGALSVFMIKQPEYTAQTSLYVSAQVGNADAQQAYQGAQLSEQRVKSYTELVTSERVASDTIRRLGLREDVADLASKISASSGVDSVLITISATDSDPSQAAAIANGTALSVSDLVSELERPNTPNGIAPVAVRMIQPAPVPQTPSSASLSVTLALGLVVGAAMGVGAAFVRHFTDRSMSSTSALSEAAGVPNLGAIPYVSDPDKRPLVILSRPRGAAAEAYRQIRTNLQFFDIQQPRKVIVVTSSTPGEGKTTTVANLALALSTTGSRVLAIEADLRRPDLSRLFGIAPDVGLTNVLTGRIDLNQATQQFQGGVIDILSSGPRPPNPSELLGSDNMKLLLTEARSRYDVVLIDTPPLLPVTDAAAVSPYADGVVIIGRYKRTTTDQIITAVGNLRAVSADLLGSILTIVHNEGISGRSRYGEYYDTDADPDALAHDNGDRHNRRLTDYPVGSDRTIRMRSTSSTNAPSQRDLP